MIKKRLWLLIVLVAVIVVATGAILGVTLARWNRRTESILSGDSIPINSGTDNGSAKYLIYAPLDAEGNIMTAEFSAGAYSFDNAVSVAVVGYSGTIGEVYVPETYTVDGNTFSVTKLLVDANLADYAFAGNQFITMLYLPHSLTYVGASVCANMTQLSSLECLTSQSSMTFGQYAFLNCNRLVSLKIGGVSVTGISRSNNAFYSTPVY